MKYILLVITFCLSALNLSYAQDTISASQTKDFVGEFKYVKGSVAEVSTSKSGTTYINFEDKYPNSIFSAVIFKDNKDAFDLAILNKCKNIIIYGKIELYKDKPQIVLNEAKQIIWSE
jgi:exonuclease VII large subunit